jgi:hypothetical protein
MTINIITIFPKEQWNWIYFTMYINAEDIFNNIKFPWKWDYLRLNTTMTYELYQINQRFIYEKFTRYNYGSVLSPTYMVDTRKYDYGLYSKYIKITSFTPFYIERTSRWRYM